MSALMPVGPSFETLTRPDQSPSLATGVPSGHPLGRPAPRKAKEGLRGRRFPSNKKAKRQRSLSFASFAPVLELRSRLPSHRRASGHFALLVKPVRRPVLPQTRQLRDAKELAATSFTQQTNARRKIVQCHHHMRRRDAIICHRRRAWALRDSGMAGSDATAVRFGARSPKFGRLGFCTVRRRARSFVGDDVGVEPCARSRIKEPI
jgi:hypothetical protein